MFIFNSKIESSERLERTLVGRQELVDNIESMVLETAKNGTLFQNLIVGPRGSGKTHILKVLHNRIIKDDLVNKNLVIAYMAEDEVGIDSFLDFFVRIFMAFKRWETNRDRISWLDEKIEELKITPEFDRNDKAKQILLEYLNDKDLIILVENLDNIFSGLKKSGQSKLRDFIQEHTNVSFYATSQALFSDIRGEDKPFYNFFNITHLKKLTLDESINLINKLAEYEGVKELQAFLKQKKGRGNIKAIYEFTQGNHRLLVLFYDFLKSEFKSDLSEPFLKTIDKLKPYYESFLKLLSPQQQKIVQHLSLERTPQTGTSISQNCFIAHNNVSKQMSELQRLGYITAFKSGKERYYELNEPLLRFCFEINEDRRGIIRIFIDFLSNLYSVDEIAEKYLYYKYMAEFQSSDIKPRFIKESELFELAAKIVLPEWKLNKEHESKLLSCSQDEREKIIPAIAKDTVNSQWNKKVYELIESDKKEEALEIVDKQIRKNGNNNAWRIKADLELDLEKYNEALISFKKLLSFGDDKFGILNNIGVLYIFLNDSRNAIKAFRDALKLNPHESFTWNNLANVYRNRKQYNKAIEYYKKAIEIDSKRDVFWFNIGTVYIKEEQYQKAKNAFEKAIRLNKRFYDAWVNLGHIYLSLKQYSKAIKAYTEALKLNSKDHEILYNLGNAYMHYKDYNQAIETFKKAIKFNPDDNTLWISLGNANFEIGNHDEAIKAYEMSVKINQNEMAFFNIIIANLNKGDLIQSEKVFYEAYDFLNDELKVEILNYLLMEFFTSGDKEKIFKAIDELLKIKFDTFTKYFKPFFITLLSNSLEHEVKEYLRYFHNGMKKQQKEKPFSLILTFTIFSILGDYKSVDESRFKMLIRTLEDIFAEEPEMYYTIKYLKVGFEYLKMDNKNAIFELSKEERSVFEKYVLKEIE